MQNINLTTAITFHIYSKLGIIKNDKTYFNYTQGILINKFKSKLFKIFSEKNYNCETWSCKITIDGANINFFVLDTFDIDNEYLLVIKQDDSPSFLLSLTEDRELKEFSGKILIADESLREATIIQQSNLLNGVELVSDLQILPEISDFYPEDIIERYYGE